MKIGMKSLALAVALLLGVASVLVPATEAQAHQFVMGKLEVTHPWARATAKSAKVAAGYMAIANNGTEPDRLLGVESDVAEKVELHQSINEGGIMKMRKLADGVALPVGGVAALEPGGVHVMFAGLKAPLVEGQPFAATLVFEKAGRLAVTFMVEEAEGE
jgi:copper(I)-binding protein